MSVTRKTYKAQYTVSYSKSAFTTHVDRQDFIIEIAAFGKNRDEHLLAIAKAVTHKESFEYSDDEALSSLSVHGVMVFRKRIMSSDSFVMTHPGESHDLSITSIEEVGPDIVMQPRPFILPPLDLTESNQTLALTDVITEPRIEEFQFIPILDTISNHIKNHDRFSEYCIHFEGDVKPYHYAKDSKGRYFPEEIGCLKCYLERVEAGSDEWSPRYKLNIYISDS